MATRRSTSTPPVHRRARRAALLAFGTNGALVGSLLPRYPEIADALGLTTGRLGFVVVAFAVGAAAAGRLPERPLRRFGTRLVTIGGTWVIAGALLIAASVTELGPNGTWLFAASLAVGGFADAIVDVAQNAEGLRVQQTLQRSVLSSMHAGWSAGATVAGLLGTLAASLGVPLPVHMAVTGLTCGALVSYAGRHFTPGEQTDADGDGDSYVAPPDEAVIPGKRRPGALVATVLVAVSGLSVEVVGNDWSAWFVREVQGVSTERAGLAVAVVLGAQFVGRTTGDRVIDALGEARSIRLSLGLIASGITAAAWAPTAIGTFGGLAVAGLGSAITVPIAFARADRLPGLPPGRGLATVGFAMRLGTLVMSPALGLIAAASSLRHALTAIAAVSILAIATTARSGR